MNPLFRETMWKQFGAAIDMLENAIRKCPIELWESDTKFWYSTYHTLFYLDYYLSYHPGAFNPPTPFTLSEFDPNGKLPDRIYSKSELLKYLEFGRKKCYATIEELTEEKANLRFVNDYKDYSMLEILIYNLRHLQHHVGQLNLLLRQNINSAPKWVSQTPAGLELKKE